MEKINNPYNKALAGGGGSGVSVGSVVFVLLQILVRNYSLDITNYEMAVLSIGIAAVVGLANGWLVYRIPNKTDMGESQ